MKAGVNRCMVHAATTLSQCAPCKVLVDAFQPPDRHVITIEQANGFVTTFTDAYGEQDVVAKLIEAQPNIGLVDARK
jgi:hypothetical protein